MPLVTKHLITYYYITQYDLVKSVIGDVTLIFCVPRCSWLVIANSLISDSRQNSIIDAMKHVESQQSTSLKAYANRIFKSGREEKLTFSPGNAALWQWANQKRCERSRTQTDSTRQDKVVLLLKTNTNLSSLQFLSNWSIFAWSVRSKSLMKRVCHRGYKWTHGITAQSFAQLASQISLLLGAPSVRLVARVSNLTSLSNEQGICVWIAIDLSFADRSNSAKHCRDEKLRNNLKAGNPPNQWMAANQSPIAYVAPWMCGK